MINSPPQIQARQILDIVYPIGIIIEFAENVNPNDIMQGQQWQLYGEGRVTVCKDSGTFSPLKSTKGSETHTLIIGEMPSHTHNLAGGDGWSGNVVGMRHNNIAKYIGCVQDRTDSPQYVNNFSGNTGVQAVQNTGGSQPHNNIQPSIVVLRYVRVA